MRITALRELAIMMKPVRYCFAGTILVFVATFVSFAQEPAQSAPPAQAQASQTGNAQTPSQPAAVLRVTTRLVLVDVVALDRKGLALTDLKAEDFSLQEGGADQKIRVFSFQQPGSTEAAATPAKLPPEMITNKPRYQPNRTLSVLLLDGLNTDLAGQKYVRQEMIKFLQKLPAGQPVAVYALSAKLRLVQDFTTDPSLLKQAINSMKGRNSPVLDNGAPYLDAASASAMAEMGMSTMLNQILLFQQENIAIQTDLRVEMTLAALKSLARTLAGYPGRKNLIWMSSTFPAQLFPTAPGSMRAQNNWRDYSEEIERTTNALSNARVAVYPVDASTLVNYGPYSTLSNTDSSGNYLGRAAAGRTGISGPPGTSSPGLGAELDRTSDDQLTRHTTMNSMAEETGGKAFYNTNELDSAVRAGIEDGATYYTIGYYPEDKNWDGKFRRIVVNVTRPGIRLRYRQGYFAADPKGYSKIDAKKQAMDLGQALSLDYPISTALLFQAVVLPPSEKTENKVLIRYGIDAHALGFELQDDGLQHASVDCAVQPFTLKGSPLTPRASTFNAGLKPEQFQLVMQRFLPCNQTLDLAPGEYVLRLGVRDNATGLIGTANARVTVPAMSPASADGSKTEEKKP